MSRVAIEGGTVPVSQRIAPCLWFDHQAEETFYVSVFKNSRIIGVCRYTEAGYETSSRAGGPDLTYVDD
jgi:predicted 3-demethylubiquinone-9 3-methyltransferase (glyoxalase superfamily)